MVHGGNQVFFFFFFFLLLESVTYKEGEQVRNVLIVRELEISV